MKLKELASVIAATGIPSMRSNPGKRRKVTAASMTILLVVPLLMAWSMLPGQLSHMLTEPRYIPALFVATWRFETLQPLTLRQRFPWRYTIELGHEGADLAIRFLPRQPNELESTGTDMPRGAWETVVVVKPHTMKVVRIGFAAD